MHRTDYTLRMRLLGEQSAAKIRPLNDARAIENGATFLSESIIFGVAGGLLVYEGVRSSLQESQRRERIEDDISTLQDEIEQLKNNLRKQQIQIDEYHLPDGVNPSILKFPKEETSELEGSKDQSLAETIVTAAAEAQVKAAAAKELQPAKSS